jgi:hypothetical protein
MTRAGVIIAVLMCGLLVPACSSRAPAAPGRSSSPVPAAPKGSSPARVTTQTVRIGRYTQVFDTPLPGDPAQASVVEGFRTAMTLWTRSQENMMLVPPVTAYVTGTALSGLRDSLARLKADAVVPAGADRFFKTRAAVTSATSAAITTCDDGSMTRAVNPRTGVPDPAYSPSADQLYMFETWPMTRLGGHWAISAPPSLAMMPDSRAKPCQPLPPPGCRPAISRAAEASVTPPITCYGPSAFRGEAGW